MPQQKRILLYHGGHSQYDSLEIFANYMAYAFQSLGHVVRPFNVNAANVAAEIQRLVSEGFDLGFCFNGIRVDADINGQPLFEFMNAPLFGMLVDHPAYHLSFLQDTNSKIKVSCIDQSHVAFISSQLNSVKPASFLPHGACPAPQGSHDKTIDLLFGGRLIDPDEIFQELTSFSKDAQQIAKNMIDYLLKDERASIEKVISETWENVEENSLLKTELMTALMTVDKYVRMTRRFNVLNAFSQSSLKITLAGPGSGWESLKWRNKDNITYLKEVNFPDMLQLMAQSWLTLNVMPGFTQGSHERVLSAAINKSLPVTDKSTWLESEFKHQENIFFYQHIELEHLAETLQELMANKSEIASMAESSFERTRDNHLWIHRAQAMLLLSTSTN